MVLDTTLLSIVENIRRFNFLYLNKTYINRDFWSQTIQSYFGEYFWENLTEVEDSRCFKYFIYLSPINSGVGSLAFEQYILDFGQVSAIKIYISYLAPIFVVYFVTWYSNNTQRFIFVPKDKIHTDITPMIDSFQNESNLRRIYEEECDSPVEGVNLGINDSETFFSLCFDSYG